VQASQTRPYRQLEPNTTFGRYHVEERIARGGMGEVWAATALGPNGFRKRVVIKTILPDLAERPDYVAMLVNEASLAAHLSHPNIVQVFDFDCVDGLYFMAMEHIAGRTLAQVLQRATTSRRSIPPWLALTVIATCCDALQYAHDFADENGRPLGLVHRDISPSNVMLSWSGNVTILDFGIAIATRNLRSERTRTLKGKYLYMSPERVRAQQGDRRADVYSLGVVLYELLTLQRPFRAPSDYELLKRIVAGKPLPPSRHAVWMPAELDEIVLKAMAVRPEERHPEAKLLAADLRAYLRRVDDVHDADDIASFLQGHFPENAQTPEPEYEEIDIDFSSVGAAPDPAAVPVRAPAPERVSAAEPVRRPPPPPPPPPSPLPSPPSPSPPPSPQPVTSVAELYDAGTRTDGRVPRLDADVFACGTRARTVVKDVFSAATRLPRKGPAEDGGGEGSQPPVEDEKWPWARGPGRLARGSSPPVEDRVAPPERARRRS
jgi:serine/threonine-protein kinase